MTLTPLAPSQTLKTKTGKGKHKKSALCANGGRVERVISKGKPVFAMLIVVSTPDTNPPSFHPSFQPLLHDFEDVFP